jgi:hypothetical protein
MEQHFSREQRLVVAVCTAITLSGHVGLTQSRHNARFFERSRHIQLCDERVCVWGTDRPGMKEIGIAPAEIVDV